MATDDTTQSELLGMPFVHRWRAMQPIEQGRPWRWGRVDMAALRQSLDALKRGLLEELQPAGAAAVRAAYEKLASTYQTKGTDAPEKRVALWVETFAAWPLCALNDAVRSWSLKDTPFMPTSGQFNACGVGAVEKRRADLADVRAILGFMERPADRNWDAFVTDPDVARKFQRLIAGLRNGENLRALRERGEI
jgi:hypothetical protein